MHQRHRKDNNELPKGVHIRPNWVMVGEAPNRTIAEFAVNGLQSYDIPAIIDSRPGFLGTAGMQLRSLRTGKVDMFRILVPAEYEEEAKEVVKIFLGGDNADAQDEPNPEEED
jgi:hypothetical protein